MELYTFGFNAQAQSLAPGNSFVPVPILRTEAIKFFWSSWCDAVIAKQDVAGAWTAEYTGTGLTATQRDHIAQSAEIKDALSNGGSEVDFFGSPMDDGLRGYVISSLETSSTISRVVLFTTDLEVEKGLPEVEVFLTSADYEVLKIKIASGGHVLLWTKARLTGEEHIVHVRSLVDLRAHMTSSQSFSPSHTPLAPFGPAQWCTNATTSIALDQDGIVHTSTGDPRYPKCLGRPYEGTSNFEPIPYLSETSITKIASGGYMSAAVSSDGELFLWGQACPGSTGELKMLNEKGISNHSDAEREPTTRISVLGEQDDSVKCLEVQIDGQEARVYDVTIGHGHILVAAEGLGSHGWEGRAVFAAGDNSRSQLGLDTKNEFAEEFQEVMAMRGKRVIQLAAVGWSSFVVTLEG